MEFVTHNEKEVSISGTSLMGYINETYATLVEVFGAPMEGDGYKVDAEWNIKFANGEVAAIYNYKDGINYNGGRGTPVEEITNWHIGGESKEVVEKIIEILVKDSRARSH